MATHFGKEPLEDSSMLRSLGASTFHTADFHGIASCELNVYAHAYRFHFTDEKQIPQEGACWWCRPGDDTSIASFLWQVIASGDVRIETCPELY